MHAVVNADALLVILCVYKLYDYRLIWQLRQTWPVKSGSAY
jgi:hypothetical protein